MFKNMILLASACLAVPLLASDSKLIKWEGERSTTGTAVLTPMMGVRLAVVSTGKPLPSQHRVMRCVPEVVSTKNKAEAKELRLQCDGGYSFEVIGIALQ